MQDPRPRPAALEVRRNGEWLDMRDGGALPPRAHHHRRAAARARRLRQALRGRASRSRCSSCSTRCCRATTRWRCDADVELGGHRPEVQPAARPRRPARLRPARAGRDDDADPRRAPTACSANVEVAGQLHRGHRAARGDLRQDAAHPGRRRWRASTSCCWTREPTARRSTPRDAKRALARGSSRGSTTTTRPRRPRRTSTASHIAARLPEDDRGGELRRAPTGRSTCRR